MPSLPSPSWLSITVKNHLLRRKDLLLPRPATAADGEASSPLSAAKPALLTAFSVSHRSPVTHAVLGSEAAGLHSLPAELLVQTFSSLDPCSLCRLAQASKMSQAIADGDQVWIPSPAASTKEATRLRWLHTAALQQERLAAEAYARRQHWRQWKRRLLGLLQAVCGVLLVLVPLLIRLASRRSERAAAAASKNATAALTLSAAASRSLDLKGATEALPYQQIVWASTRGAAPCAA
uniref:F-box domain-containing protein n=1 Tax=Haptolina brevifila TaxID=156173 RepID=A0A7S2MES2_9EUKA|mmetsp:Transcript_50820/g.101140  ORF Transcript_50820/g.101140 Transcript_50820/m.101140 type:complete len:236 (+) Transcript_50820:109-816(+)